MTDPLRDRYTDLGPLGAGGMGEVRRAHDRVLDRDVALKTLRWTLLDSPRARVRFEAEATMTAGLTHPGIVPVYDRGTRADGCPWYTMKLVEGRTLAEALADGLPLRRAVEAFARVCEAMAYAHARGVVHRDIKPDNIMIGAFGEVLLMDWGLARPIGSKSQTVAAAPRLPVVGVGETMATADAAVETMATAAPAVETMATAAPGEPLGSAPTAAPDGPTGPTPGDGLTGTGAVIGTPAYMAPEQLDPSIAPIGPPVDVYALGGTLFQIVTGRRPRTSRQAAIDGLLDGIPVRLTEGPAPLRAIADRALDLDPTARFPDAGALGEAVRAWLDGEQRREQARRILADAERLEPRSAELRAEAERIRAEADAILGPLPPHAPVDEKAPGWALEDRAAEAERQARLADVRCLQAVQTALRTAPDLPAAREHLTRYYRRRLLAAEAARDADTAAEYAELLRSHDPEGNAQWLRGDGALTLVTDPPGARVRVFRYVMRRRRLEPVFERELPPTPLYDHPLAMGSYAIELTLPGHAPVTYPVLIERNGRWDGVRPGDDSPHAIWMPPDDAIGDDSAYVPAGWFVSGDPSAPDGLPRRKVWVDGFVMRTHPVTNAEYIEWLDWLVDQGREDEAARHAPRTDSGGGMTYARDQGGHFVLRRTEGMTWTVDMPVTCVSWHSAMAYSQWFTAVSDASGTWRLPHSFEWEKAARGVDGRLFGWGDHFDSTWAATARSAPGRPVAVAVDARPQDVGPYGVQGLAGNVRDLCLDGYRREGPPLHDGRLVVPDAVSVPANCMLKGGAFTSAAELNSAAVRFGWPPEQTAPAVGFRLCRDVRRRWPSTSS